MGDFARSLFPRYANAGRAVTSTPFGSAADSAPTGLLYNRVGDVRLLWLDMRVGVYFTERLDELVSEVPLNRRVATGILEAGEGRA